MKWDSFLHRWTFKYSDQLPNQKIGCSAGSVFMLVPKNARSAIFHYLDVGVRSFSDVNRMWKVLNNRHVISHFKALSVGITIIKTRERWKYLVSNIAFRLKFACQNLQTYCLSWSVLHSIMNQLLRFLIGLLIQNKDQSTLKG